jgi:hypothetical protein
MLKKGDKIILLSIAVIFISYFTYTTISGLSKDKIYAVIEVDGEKQERIELVQGSKEQTIEIKQKNGQVNIVRIKDGKAKMLDANCPDKFCLHMPETRTPNMNIICIPNRVFILIEGENDELDRVVR